MIEDLEGEPVVVVEDVTTTGGSTREVLGAGGSRPEKPGSRSAPKG